MVLFITFTIDSGKILYNKPAFTNTSTISYSSVSRVKFSYLKTNFKDNIFKLCTPQKTLHLHYKDKSVNYENNQKEALYILIYYSKSALHVSGDVLAHHQEYLALFTVSGSVHQSCCWLVSWMIWNRTSSFSIHPRHQPAATWVNTTRYCK